MTTDLRSAAEALLRAAPGSLDGDAGPEAPESAPAASAREPAGRELCYESSKWHRHLWGARLAASPAVREAVGHVAAPVADHGERRALRAEQPDRNAIAEAREEGAGQAEAFGAEVFARLYGDPAALPEDGRDPAAPWAPALHQALDQLPEWQDLRAAVAGDPDFAALAARDLLETAAGRLPDLLKEEEQEQQAQDGAGQGQPGDGQGQGAGRPARKPAIGAADLARGALRGACRRAARDVAGRREAMEGLAPGAGSVPPAGEQGDVRRLSLAERVGRDPQLRRVLALAGRLQRVADQRRRTRNEHAREEVVDVERGSDLSRLLPAGLAQLRHPGLRRVALRNILERQALQYRLEGTEPEGRGPIVVLLDESGSMSGTPHEWARAVGIACLGVAARERRACTVVGFDGGIRSAVHLDTAGRSWTLPVLDASAPRVGAPVALGTTVDAVLHVASQGCPGGTDFGPALRLALDGLPAGVRDPRADLVLVTDGCADADERTLAALDEARAAGLRVHGLTVNGGSLSGSIARICTRAVDIDAAARVGKGDAAGQVGEAIP